MATKKKAGFTAEPQQLVPIQEMVRKGRYRTSSEFLREAIDEKLARLRRESLAEQVAGYCTKGYAREDGDLVTEQAFDPER